MDTCVTEKISQRISDIENKNNENKKRIKEGRNNADAHASEIVRLREKGVKLEEIKRIFEACGVVVSQKRLAVITIPTWTKVYSVFFGVIIAISFLPTPVVFFLVGYRPWWGWIPGAVALLGSPLFFLGKAFKIVIALWEDAKESLVADGF